MLFHEYETTIIIRPDLDDAATYGIVEKMEGVLDENGGKLLLRDDWGKRKLAYAIERHLKGHYVLFNFLAGADLVSELERRIRIQDGIIRFMTVRVADAVDVDTRIAEAAEIRARREAEAAARANDEDDDDRDDLDDDGDEDDD